MSKLDWEKANRRRARSAQSDQTMPILGDFESTTPVRDIKPWDQGIEPRVRPKNALSLADAIEAVRDTQRQSYKQQKHASRKGGTSTGR